MRLLLVSVLCVGACHGRRAVGSRTLAFSGSSTALQRHVEVRRESKLRMATEWASITYNGGAIEKFYGQRPLAVISRAVKIGPPALAWYLESRLVNVTAKLFPEVEVLSSRGRGRRLRRILANSGSVTFIKSGQALSLRQDIIKDREIAEELAKLQDEVGTFPNADAMRIIQEDLGSPAEEIFEFLEKDPIASASIGQVYKARLRSSGQLVAVKVQRPDAAGSAAVDMFVLRRFAAWLKKSRKLRSDMVGIADEFGGQLFQELDYQQEARNCLRFKDLYGKIPGIYVPEAYPHLTSRRVLTMEFVEGEKGPWPLDGRRLLTVGLQCSVLQVLQYGFFHADPHRGNLLKTPDGRLAYLDFGMMANVTADKRYALLGTTLGLQNRDVGLVAANLVKLGFLEQETNLTALVPALENALQTASGGKGATALNFTRLNEEVGSLAELLSFRIPPFYSIIVRTLTILEGLALFVDKDFRLVKGAYPYIAKQILTSDIPEMKDLMKAVLVTKENGIRWRRLEQLVSIAGAAKIARTDEDFERLKKAQDRSDLRKKMGMAGGSAGSGSATPALPASSTSAVGGSSAITTTSSSGGSAEDEEVTLDLTVEILQFLLSEQGRFLREPLINELLDVTDSLQLATINMASSATGGVLGRARNIPDKAKLDALTQLVVQVARNSGLDGRSRGGAAAGGGGGSGGGGADLPRLRAVAERVRELLNDPVQQQRFQPVLAGLGDFSREVFARSLERRARRAVRSGFDRLNAPQTFPAIANVLDALAPAAIRLLPRDSAPERLPPAKAPAPPAEVPSRRSRQQ